jgi:hypothetical protein
MKKPFISATSGQKQTSPMAATGNSETFEYELGYVWLDILGSRGTFCSYTQMKKHNTYSDSPRNYSTFEYKVRPASEQTLRTSPRHESQCCTLSDP